MNIQNQLPVAIADLSSLSRSDLPLAGGKGANLGELVRAGFPVPQGFVITTRAYEQFVEYNRLSATIAAFLERQEGDSAALRAAFERSTIPPEIAQAILAAYQRLGGGAVAVRSSATAEDLPEAAFAGQQDTYLNILTPEALLDAVRSCWASLWSERAIAYRKRQGIDQAQVKIAVVVQKLIAAEAAGVMFTANPVTGARDEVVIDASPGLGEAVVSGKVTPDHTVLQQRKGAYQIKEQTVGMREVVIEPSASGGTEERREQAEQRSPALPEHALIELARLGLKIERHFGSPQDVEWAWQGGKPYILQARPITALPQEPPRPSKLVQMLSAIFAEMIPVRPYPLDMTAWMKALSDAVLEPIFSLIGLVPPSFDQLFIQADDVVTFFKPEVRFRPTLGVLLAPARLVWLALRYHPSRWRQDPLLLAAQERVQQLANLQLEALSWRELLQAVDEVLKLPRPLAGEMRRRYLPRALFAVAGLAIILKVLGYSRYLGTLLSGAESETIAANQALEDLAGSVRADAELSAIFAAHPPAEIGAALEQSASGRAFLEELERFLKRYGHREVVISTALEPTWGDAPEIVLGIIQGMAVATPPAPSKPVWQQKRDQVLTHPLLIFPSFSRLFTRALDGARWLWRMREDTHFMATTLLPLMRHLALEMGRRLRHAGVIDDPADVFHLRLDELKQLEGNFPPGAAQANQLREWVRRRKQVRQSLEGKPVVDPRLFQQVSSTAGVLLRGTSGSPGEAEGAVRVIRDSSEFGKLLPGEVLVAPYTNPAWTILFQRARAVVVDGGAAGSHAAIVAREYGIPAVMGTASATQTLHDGDWVLVDGTHGVVRQSPRPKQVMDVEEKEVDADGGA